MRMIREASIKTKIHVPLILAILLGLAIIIITSYRSLHSMESEEFSKQAEHLVYRVDTATTAKQNVWLTNAMQLAKNEDIIRAFVDQDREKLVSIFGKVGDEYRNNTPFKRVAVHLIGADLTSVFKNWKPESYGESLAHIKSYAQVAKTKKPMVTYEESAKGLRMRGLFPIMDGDRFAGILNFEGGINNFGGEMKKEGILFLYYLDKQYANLMNDDKERKEGHVLSSGTNIDKAFHTYAASDKFSLEKAIQSSYVVDDEYFVVATALKDFDDRLIGWALTALPTEVIEHVIEDASNALINQVIIMACIDIFLLVFLGVMISRAVTGPIGKLKDVIQDLVEGEGDLTKRLNYNLQVKDEISGIAIYIDEFIAHMHGVIKEAKSSSGENVASSEELSQTATQMGKRTEENANITEQTAEKTDEIKRLVESSVAEAGTTKTGMSSAQNELATAKESTGRLSSIVSGSVQKEQELTDRLNQLNSDVSQIKDVLTIISDIADQTNLLALNAAIEAARAGEHGRGFAVVADEVRKLAERTQKSLTEINSTVNVIVQAIMEASENMNKNMEEISELHEVTEEVEGRIDNVSEVMMQASASSDRSLEVSERIRSNIDEMKNLMEEIRDNSMQDSRSIEEIAATAEHLEQKVVQLNAKLDQFKI